AAHSLRCSPRDVFRIRVARIGAPLTAYRGRTHDDVFTSREHRRGRHRWKVELAGGDTEAGRHALNDALGSVADLPSWLARWWRFPCAALARDVLRLGAQIGLRSDEVYAGDALVQLRPGGIQVDRFG